MCDVYFLTTSTASNSRPYFHQCAMFPVQLVKTVKQTKNDCGALWLSINNYTVTKPLTVIQEMEKQS